MAPTGESKSDGFVAKAVGVAVVSGIAWSILKPMTSPSRPTSSNLPKQIYHVSQGDTLFSLSLKFGVPMEDLKAANRVHGDEIFAGDQLVIPK